MRWVVSAGDGQVFGLLLPLDFGTNVIVLIRTGGEGKVETQALALKTFFEVLASGGTVSNALTTGNKVIEDDNRLRDGKGEPMKAYYGSGITETNVFRDLLRP